MSASSWFFNIIRVHITCFEANCTVMCVSHLTVNLEGGGVPRNELTSASVADINPLKTKRRLLYLKTQFVPRSKHFSSRL